MGFRIGLVAWVAMAACGPSVSDDDDDGGGDLGDTADSLR